MTLYGWAERDEWRKFLDWRLRTFYARDASPSLSTASHGPRQLSARLTDEEISERWPDKSREA